MLANGYERVITTTDRPKRSKEVDGVDYKFVPRGQLDHKFGSYVCKRKFYVANGDCYTYGIPYEAVDKIRRSDDSWVIVIDPQGAMELMDLMRIAGLSVYVIEVTASNYILAQRASKRGDTNEEFRRRIEEDAPGFEKLRRGGLIDITVGTVQS